ncbi:MAG: hypothetical protein P1V51_09455 [Deltaproteobacteria bacterium]|nr:hypothetical protein [Deltaproteobacteria bacterium]
MSYWDPYDARFTSQEGGLIQGNLFHRCGSVNCLHFLEPGGEEVAARGARILDNVFAEDLLCCLSVWGGEDIEIRGNTCAGDLGIFSRGQVDVTLSRNTFVGTTYSGCVLCLDAQGARIEDNAFTSEDEEVYAILDAGEGKRNQLSWGNEWGEARWVDRSGLTIPGNVGLGDKIDVQQDRIVIARHPALTNLDGFILLSFEAQTCEVRPRVLRDGVPCAELEGCEVTDWQPSLGRVRARVDGRGDYRTACPAP